MSKRLDPSGLEGAFARRRRTTQLDFLVPTKDEAEDAPQAPAPQAPPAKARKTSRKKAPKRVVRKQLSTSQQAARPAGATKKATKQKASKKKTTRKASKARASTRRRAVAPRPSPESSRSPEQPAQPEVVQARALVGLPRWTPGATTWAAPQGRRARWRSRLERRWERLVGRALRRLLSRNS